MIRLINFATNTVTTLSKSTPNHKFMLYTDSPVIFNTFGLAQIKYTFAKKQTNKPKKGQTPRVQPKSDADYIRAPDTLKKNIIQIQNMQTTSEANLQEQSLKEVIISQRNFLSSSLKEQFKNAAAGKDQKASEPKSKIFNDAKKEDMTNRYFLQVPLKYIHTLYLRLFAFNFVGFCGLEIMESYHYIGWFFGIVTSPVAASTLALLGGYNLAFWVVRQSFYLHIPLQGIQQTKLSLISTTLRNIAQLAFIALQLGSLFYSIFFPIPIPIHQIYLFLAATNFLSLYMNLRSIAISTNLGHKIYVSSYVRLASAVSLLLLLFTAYQIQFLAAEQPENTYDSQYYRKRIVEMREGFLQFKKVLKTKNYVMKEDEKINPQ